MFKKILLAVVILIILSGAVYGVILLQRSSPQNPAAKVADGPVLVGPAPEFKLELPMGFRLGVFTQGLGNPRDMLFTPGGTLLVSIPSQKKVVALPDKDANGVADTVIDVATDLNNPHGIGFFGDKLFIAEETQVARYFWDEQDLVATQEKILFQLPPGGNHRTRSIEFNAQGQMFISLGSTCNVCYEKHDWLAAIIVSDSEGATPQRYAKGLRNAVFLKLNPQTQELWASEMGRDYLGDFTPPDEINIIQSNRDYGWPLCWGEKIHDSLFDQNIYIQDPCARTEAPHYGIPAHSAPLGLTFITSAQFPKEWQGDVLVSYHGSWNRTSPVGYKVVRLDVKENDIIEEKDFITGFIKNGTVFGRPVDLEFDSQGSLYISDDKTGMIYKVVKAS